MGDDGQMQNDQKTERKAHQPLYIGIGLICIAAGIALDIYYPRLNIPYLPHWMSDNYATELRCLGIGLIVGSFFARKPKKAVEGSR